MASKNVGSTLDREGNLFYLQTSGPRFWRIVSAFPITKDQCYRVVAVGQEAYVRGKWRDFIAHEKEQRGK